MRVYRIILGLTLALIAVRAQAWLFSEQTEWVSVATPHLVVISDANEDTAIRFAQELEQLRFFAHIMLSIEFNAETTPLTIYALNSKKSLKKFDLEQDVAGIFLEIGNERFAVADLRSYNSKSNYARQTLLHEYVHYLVSISSGNFNYPLWYREGMADFISTVRFMDNLIIYGLPNDYRVRSIDARKPVPVEKIFKTEVYPESKRENDKFYAYSWLLMHFFFNNHDLNEKLTDFIRLYDKGIDTDLAFKEAFGMTYQGMAANLRKHMRSKTPAYTLQPEVPFQMPSYSTEKLIESDVEAGITW